MAANSFQIVIITQEETAPNERDCIVQLFKEGLETLHIRKPSYTIDETRNLLISIPSVFHPKIVIHSHYDLLHDFNLKGEHLPESVRTGRKQFVNNKTVSTSFHSLNDILIEKVNFEYAFFGPVFESISKQGYRPSTGVSALKDFFHSNQTVIHFPIIALGGIAEKNILAAKEMGFKGAASIGYIWDSSNPVEQFKKLQNILQV